MKKPEILSPAGDMLCLKAAVTAGCDAVYLGGQIFGARAFSKNFSEQELIEAVTYCHGYGVKVYVTVNTLVYENEVETFINYIDFLHKNNVDAIIIQDIGMADLVRQTFPDLEVHASTQMHIHNLEGVKLVEEMGFKRAVLARETPIELIKEIKDNTGIELEIFVHGALCISYSGQCLMSSLIGGRSGNRGTCAGSCRLKYDVLDSNKKIVNKEKYNLSTKDLNCLENLGQLMEIGVDSLKIEGRMKSPEYVYLVTKLYRKAVDSYFETKKVVIDKEELKNLMKTFNREYTKGFIFHEENKNFINPFRPNNLGVELGHVIKKERGLVYIKLVEELVINDGIRFINSNGDDEGLIVTKMLVDSKEVSLAKPGQIVAIPTTKFVTINNKVLKTSDYKVHLDIANALEVDLRKIYITGKIRICVGEPIQVEISDGIVVTKAEGNTPIEKAINQPTSREKVLEQIEKTGGTVCKFRNIVLDYDGNAFVSIREINEVRREAINKLLDIRYECHKKFYRKANYSRKVTDYPIEKLKSVYVKDQKTYEKAKNLNFDLYYVDSSLYNAVKDEKVIRKIPRVLEHHLSYDEPLLVGELGSVRKYKSVITDFSLNVVNSYSVALLNSLGVKRITLSYELTDTQIKDLIEAYKNRYNANPNLALIVFGREEMMISKFKLLSYYNLPNKGYIKDRFSTIYEVREEDNLMYIYNSKIRKLNNLNKYYEMGISELRFNILNDNELYMIKDNV